LLDDGRAPGAGRRVVGDNRIHALINPPTLEGPRRPKRPHTGRLRLDMADSSGPVAVDGVAGVGGAFGIGSTQTGIRGSCHQNPLFIEKVPRRGRAVSGPAGAPHWCYVWTRETQIQGAQTATQPVFPDAAGQAPGAKPATTTCATAPQSLYAALDIASGQGSSDRCTRPRHRRPRNFLAFLKKDRPARPSPLNLDLPTIVLDNALHPIRHRR